MDLPFTCFLLLVGIQSDIFKYNESSTTFHMKKNVTIDCFLPATILNFVDEFLECGTCYRRLQTMISRTNYSLKFEGFMFKVLNMDFYVKYHSSLSYCFRTSFIDLV